MNRIGPYVIQGELARGGQGVVLRGVDPMGREVAIKLLLGASEKQRERFRREGEALARLSHPSVVPVRSAGEHQGQPYLVLDLIQGGSLAERLRTGPIKPRVAARIALAIAEALEHVHRLGVLHRDLKPSNVILGPGGKPILVDFGLAKDQEQSDLTRTGAMVGTLGFCPPEQLVGNREQLGPPADVFGLGATLYTLLTGRPPFAGESVATLAVATQVSVVEPPSALAPGVERDLERIVLHCLEKEPAERFPTAAALAEALRRYLAGEPLDDLLGAEGPRKRVIALVLAALVVALTSIGLWSRTGQAQQGPSKTVAKKTPAKTAPAKPIAIAPPPAVSPPEPKKPTPEIPAKTPLDRQGPHLPGLELIRQGKPREAVRLWDKVLSKEPDDVLTLFHRGTSHVNLGNFAQALADYDRAVKLAPQLLQLRLYRARIRTRRMNDHRGALADLEVFLRYQPNSSTALFEQGSALNQMGSPKRALESFKKALQRSPTMHEAHMNMGVSFGALGCYAEAIHAFEEALRLMPADDSVRPLLRRNLKLAREDLAKARKQKR